MRLELPLQHPAARGATLGGVISVCGWLLYVVLCDFLVGALTDERIRISADAPPASFITAPFTDDRIGVNPDILAAVARRFPNSPRLHMRLADLEKYETNEDNRKNAKFHAMRAVRLSPYDYRPHLVLAAIQEYGQDFQAAERSVRAAVQLAPGYLETHWQLAVVLLRNGNRAAALEQFRVAASGHTAYFQAALKLVWSEWGQSVDALGAITPDNPKDRLGLARFLLEQKRILESAAVFRQIDHAALLGNLETSQYLNSLIATGDLSLAHDLWYGLLAGEAAEETKNFMWNGSFESDILVDFAQFDWSIQPSDYARISIDSRTAHTGRRSLSVDFIGRETTRIECEILERILVRPVSRYRLQYYIITQDLVVTEGPRVVVSGTTWQQWIAASEPARAGSSDWQRRTLEFSATSPALIVAIQQRPRFSYEDPTHGTVWFDDFELEEIRN